MMTTPKPPPLDSESCTSLRREGHAVVNLLEPPSPLVCSFKNERRLLSNPKKAAAAELNQAAPVDVDVRTQQLPTLEDICHKGSVVTVRHQPPPRPNRSNRMFVFDKVKTKEFFDEKENKPKSLSMSLMSAESLIEKQDDSESTMMDETETETETETESGEIGEGPWDTSIVAGAGALPPVAFVPEVVATTNFWELCYGVPAPRVVDTRSLSAQRPPPSKSCLSTTKKRSLRTAFPTAASADTSFSSIITDAAAANHAYTTPQSSPVPMVVVDRGENSSSSSAVTTAAALVHFAPSSAVEFQLDVPVSRSLTPMPAHVAAQRFPTEPKAVSVDEQAAIDEAKRNDALLKEWDSLLDDDEIHGEDLEALFGPEANRRRRRRESFYLASTSSDPLIKATIGSARLTGCATITGVLENSNNNNKVCSDDYSMDSISIDKSGPLRSDDFRFNEAFRMNSEDSLGMSTEDDDEDKEKLPNLESLDILTGSPVELEAETGNEMILKNVDAQRPKKTSSTCFWRFCEEPEVCVGSFEKLNTLQLLQCLASRNLPCKEEVSSFEQKSESAMGSFYALCATHPSCLRPLLEQGLGNLQGHTALLHSPHSNDQNCLQSDTVLLPDDLKDKLAIIADYHWKTLECKMLENLSFRMDVESNDLSDATSVLQQAVDALKSRRLPPTCIKQLMDANLQACVELDGELNKEIAVQQILTHQERSLAHLDCAICTLRNVATCNLLPFNNALTPDQLCFVYSSPVESIEIRVSCDVFGVIGAITDIEVLENHPLLIDKSRISTNHADALFYHTLLTAGIQSLFPPDCFGSNGSPTDIMRLSIFLGRLAMATNDLALVAKQHAVSVDCVQLDRLLLSINMTKGNNDSCKIEVVYDLTDEFLLFSALPMDVKVVSEKNIEQQPEFAEAVSQALLVRGVVGSAMLLQEFCEYIQSYTTLSDSSCPESPTLDV